MDEGKLMAGRCKKCGKMHFPPRQLCDKCLSREFEWTQMPTQGRLLTYTIIHIAPTQFQAMAPYAMGIIELDNGPRILGMIQNMPLDQLKIGIPLSIAFEPHSETPQWPRWARFHFKPI
jgi:uncharacterized OB-fold protein